MVAPLRLTRCTPASGLARPWSNHSGAANGGTAINADGGTKTKTDDGEAGTEAEVEVKACRAG